MLANPKKVNHPKPGISKKSAIEIAGQVLYHLAFDNSLQANILSIVSSGNIIAANRAACKLLGYSKRELLTKDRSVIFDINQSSFKKMLKQRTAEGHSTALVTAIQKSGKQFRCEITSSTFVDKDGTEKSITTIVDIRQSIFKQKSIDIQNKKIVSDNIVLAKLKQKNIDIRNRKIVSCNIILAKSKQKALDIKKGKKVADNIVLAQAKQKVIDIVNDKIVADNIVLAQSKQKTIDTQNDKIVADNIVSALLQSNARLAYVYERTDKDMADIGEALKENVSQILFASRTYLGMAMQGGENNEMYLSRSSEYILTAIAEIEKLAKRMTIHVIENLGLCVAIDNFTRSVVEGNLIRISCKLEGFIENSVNVKFKVSVFRIVEEQLNNILKYTKATRLTIHLSHYKQSIILSILDNSVSFQKSKKRNEIGIDIIKSRAESFNGITDFTAQSGQYCGLTITFPIADTLLLK